MKAYFKKCLIYFDNLFLGKMFFNVFPLIHSIMDMKLHFLNAINLNGRIAEFGTVIIDLNV